MRLKNDGNWKNERLFARVSGYSRGAIRAAHGVTQNDTELIRRS